SRDYVAYLVAQSAALAGDPETALPELRALAEDRNSRFHDWAAWRAADCLWQLGRVADARAAYAGLLGHDARAGDPAVARFRIAEADARAGNTESAVQGFTALRMSHPGHALEPAAEARLAQLGGEAAMKLGAAQRISRAVILKEAKKWDQALAELAQVSEAEPEGIRRERDFWMAMTLFRMRKQYQRASDILLRIYRQMGERAAEALFHGARALSRADRDADAIVYYQKVVAEYPRSDWAAEAQFLSGWLEFNRGRFREALPGLAEMRRRFPRSKFAVDALWYSGFASYLVGEHEQALRLFTELAGQGGRMEGGKGQYWRARTLDLLGRKDEAGREYRGLVGRFPMSWYALLARARLAERKEKIDPFGDRPRSPDACTEVASRIDPRLAADPLIRRADELTRAGLDVEAGEELERGEKAFLKRHARPAALAVLLDRYRKASNFHRPWELASSFGGNDAFDAPPRGRARIWWEHSLPLAYREWVEKYRSLGGNPDYYLYAVMRKESGFNPHDHSYADAIGLLQMIPPTTRRVAPEVGLEYTDDLLFEPELNIKTGSWYIGRLLHKFDMQVPLGAGAFNGGPGPVMRWLEKYGERPMDELVELVAYTQTREYMKKVTEIYARYLYFHRHAVYEQPLAVKRDYARDELTY
ncbi:MAG TPA: transglycosylase SLT domain-containing protein, partial [Candidatus Acidoferrum sp.]|nr:transglycosylase SLT domain-containing protein [Candidatus Acidoferrum sp.]